MHYAKDISVSAAKSRAEIAQTLTRYKADQFATAIDNEACRAAIQFRINGKSIRFELPLPNRQDKALTHYRKFSLSSKRQRGRTSI